VKARKVGEIRQIGCVLTLDALPGGDLHDLDEGRDYGRIAVGLTYVPRDKRRRDPDNLVVPLFKALVDGIVDAGIVPDDTPEYVIRSMPVILPPDGDPRLVLVISEVLA
jgi:crossover junction endodeoxyribonuclease RusA